MTNPVKTIAQVIAEHTDDPANPNGGGILATCTCGAAYDWLPDHQQEMILKECFPHLAQVHEDLITSHDGWLTKRYYKAKTKAYEALEEDIARWAELAAANPHAYTEGVREPGWGEGYKEAAAHVQGFIQRHDV